MISDHVRQFYSEMEAQCFALLNDKCAMLFWSSDDSRHFLHLRSHWPIWPQHPFTPHSYSWSWGCWVKCSSVWATHSWGYNDVWSQGQGMRPWPYCQKTANSPAAALSHCLKLKLALNDEKLSLHSDNDNIQTLLPSDCKFKQCQDFRNNEIKQTPISMNLGLWGNCK